MHRTLDRSTHRIVYIRIVDGRYGSVSCVYDVRLFDKFWFDYGRWYGMTSVIVFIVLYTQTVEFTDSP
jgi:hypothetical protein